MRGGEGEVRGGGGGRRGKRRLRWHVYLSDVKLLGKNLVSITPLLLHSIASQRVQHFGLRVHTSHMDKHHVVIDHHLSSCIPSGS